MYETATDLVHLQELLDRSYDLAGSHLRTVITQERRLTAADVATRLQGMCLLALATVTRDCRPLVGPVDGIFYRGAFYFGSSPTSVRLQHIARRPQVSATHLPGEELAVTVHGRARPIDVRARQRPASAKPCSTSTSHATAGSGRRSSTLVRFTRGSTRTGCSRCQRRERGLPAFQFRRRCAAGVMSPKPELLLRQSLPQLSTAATATPARCFNLADRGCIAPGTRADLVLVHGDPTTAIDDVRDIAIVWKNGYEIPRASSG